jgi:hypothetical protein
MIELLRTFGPLGTFCVDTSVPTQYLWLCDNCGYFHEVVETITVHKQSTNQTCERSAKRLPETTRSHADATTAQNKMPQHREMSSGIQLESVQMMCNAKTLVGKHFERCENNERYQATVNKGYSSIRCNFEFSSIVIYVSDLHLGQHAFVQTEIDTEVHVRTANGGTANG